MSSTLMKEETRSSGRQTPSTTWHCLLDSLNSCVTHTLCSDHRCFLLCAVFMPRLFIHVYLLPLHPFYIWLMPRHPFKLTPLDILCIATSTLYLPEHLASIPQSHLLCCRVCSIGKSGGYSGIRQAGFLP